MEAAPSVRGVPMEAEPAMNGVVVKAAEAGDTDVSTPKPNADTATSAIRLIDAFVDIYFLSKKVESKNFLPSAGAEDAYSCVMSALSCSP